MATATKKKKAPVAKPIDFTDKAGELLAVGDYVSYTHPTSTHSGGFGTITAIHPRQDSETPPIATVQLDKLSTWKEAPAIPAFADNLTFIRRPTAMAPTTAEHPAVEQEPELPWLDCDGTPLLEGDVATVLPDVSKRLSGKQVRLVVGQERAQKSVEVELVTPDEHGTSRVLLSYLRRLPVLGESVVAPTPVERMTKVAVLGSPSPELVATFKQAAGVPVMDAFAKAAEISRAHDTGLRMVPLASIVVTTNTRQVFDESALAELAESVKAHGILQPIVLRPHATESGKYELVAGGRRYRAAQLAELAEMPATVRNLTDREFLEVQLLENLQRVDVRPADEAQAFSKLLKNNFSAEEVALKVGKPVKFVLQRAKLATLIPNWFEKLENGTIELAAAHELARLPVHSQLVVWRKADEEIKANVWKAPNALADTFKKSYVRDLIEEEVLRDLSTAIWPLDDATLDLSAGACTQCPKRSSCQGLLFAAKDPDKDRCLDGVCFAGKRIKYLARRVREVKAELGTEPLQVSTYYSPEKKEGTEAVLGTKDFNWSRVDMPGAVPAVVMDGNDAGQLRYVLLRQVLTGSGSGTTTKEERAASLRNTRTKRVTNELLAGDLRDLFAQSLPSGGAAANALLDHFLDHALTWGYSRIPTDTLDYLVAAHGWAAPTEQDLNGSYVSVDQPSGHRQYIRRQLDAIPSVLAKVVLYFDLKKFRNGLEQKEPTHAQRTLLAALPKDMQKSLAIDERATAAVEERYYTKKGKKQEATA